MSLVNMWVGATTPSSARVVAKVDSGSSASLWLADNEGFSDAVQVDSASLSSEDIAQLEATGLDHSTRYWYRIEDGDGVDTGVAGTFRTHPPLGEPGEFTVGVSTCAGGSTQDTGAVVGPVLASNRVSNHSAFEVMRQQALADNWLCFIHAGDMHYYDLGSGNHGISGGGSLANYRRAIDDVLLQPNQHGLYSQCALVWAKDDHDWAENNSDGTAAGRDNALQVYRERVPHYPLGDSDIDAPLYHAFQACRTLFIVSDVRADRSPNSDPDGPSKTMLGSDQKAWMAALLQANAGGAEFFVWVTPSQWLGTSADTWGSFATERDELVQMWGDTGWLHRMCALSGDNHNMGIASAAANSHGGFPFGQFSPIDSAGSSGTPSRWDVGHTNERRGLFGTLRVRDMGASIQATMTGWAHSGDGSGGEE